MVEEYCWDEWFHLLSNFQQIMNVLFYQTFITMARFENYICDVYISLTYYAEIVSQYRLLKECSYKKHTK